MTMCDSLKALLSDDLIPYVKTACYDAEKRGEGDRAAELATLLESLEEMIEEIDDDFMDEWECGELYEEFKRYRDRGEFLDKIS